MEIFWLLKAAQRSPAKDEVEKFLYESLGTYLMSEGLASPEIEYGHYGKPKLADEDFAGVHFSLSHTGGAAVLAFSDSEIGIDIERLGRFDRARNDNDNDEASSDRMMRIAERFFAEDEVEFVVGNGLDPGSEPGMTGIVEPGMTRSAVADGELTNDLVERFFRIWTAKEAYMKWTGRGFAEGFETFSVFGVEPEIRTFRGPEDIVCSVCGEGSLEIIGQTTPTASGHPSTGGEF